ncbi:MAG: hypothetical protein JRN51_07590 [Nitrososphaerota archaeon]|jgi:hypothetical protein|nr:hypothetical protein [Nitrososphaerota archaeon]MDG6977460.1 hypothetical protein [Nitrososphaerota archaeon]MDG6980958.1 hypothetical protein [Nitrososphaerota archaeon]
MTSSPDEKSVGVMAIDAHEELMQQLEAGRGKIRLLSGVTIAVAFLLCVAYFSQIVLPLTSSSNRYQTVDLLNPTLVATEVFLIALGAAWLYVGVANYLFSRRLNERIREIRSYEKQLMEKMDRRPAESERSKASPA